MALKIEQKKFFLGFKKTSGLSLWEIEKQSLRLKFRAFCDILSRFRGTAIFLNF